MVHIKELRKQETEKYRLFSVYLMKMNMLQIFVKKAELFNSFFAKQCYLLSTESKLPSRLRYFTGKRLLTIKFSGDDIFDII